MTVASSISVELEGREVGLAALLTKVDQQTQKAADSALRLQAQYARLAQAQGNTGQATSILSQALLQNKGASEQAVAGVATQLTKIQQGTTYFTEFGTAAKSSLLGIVGPAAAVGVAFQTATSLVQSFGEAFKFKTQLDANTAAIRAQLQGVRDSNQVYAEGRAFANQYKLTQAELNDTLQSSVGVMRLSTASTTDLLETLSRLQTLAPEKPISEAARALRELASGDTTSIKELFNLSARDANKMKAEIQGGADAVTVLSGYLDGLGVSMDTVAAKTTGAAGAMKDLAVAQENLKIAQAGFAQGPGLVILQGQIQATTGATRLLSGDMDNARRSIAAAADQGSFGFNLFNAIMGGTLTTMANYQRQADASAASTQISTQAVEQNAQATVQLGAAMDAERTAVAALSVEHDKQTAALIDQIAKKQATAQASTQLTQVETILANIGNAVASGQTTAANGAIAFANAAGIATGKAYELVAAQAALSNAAPPATAGQIRVSGANAYQSEIDRSIKSNAAAYENTKKYQDAQLALARAHKDTAAEVAILRERQTRLNKTSAEYIQLEAQIVNAQASGKKGGGGAGGVKLTDQAKLNNALISNEEQYQQKYDDLDAQHSQKRLDILQDYYERVGQATADFEQDQLEGRASFYDNLGSIENQKIAKAASAAYEQAAVEAGKIAQEKGADVADKYMQAQEQVISARAKRQAEIEKAAKEGEKGRAEYLKGVDAQYRAAEDAKIARIKEGGGSLAEQRDKQLRDEDQAYEEQTGKLADHAEASADRRIAAAQRAGKAIDDEAAKAAALGDVYNKIAPNAPTAATPAPGTPQAAPVPTQAPTPTTAGVAGAPADPIVTAITAAKDALISALSAIERSTKETTGAVKSIKATGGVAG